MIQSLAVAVSDINAACLNIRSVIGVSQSNSIERFVDFLKVLETYGCGYRDDIDYKAYKIRETYSHRSEAVKVLKDT